jgi:cation/acetate symporter
LQKIGDLEKKITADPIEVVARGLASAAAAEAGTALKDPGKAASDRRAALEQRLAKAKADNAPDHVQKSIQQALDNTPTDPAKAREYWSARRNLGANANPPRVHSQPFPGATEQAQRTARLNFLGIVFCMMFGTAALPHILMRYYTTPSVRQARQSVFWSLFFIFLLYFTAPCLAALAKYDVYSNLVGSKFSELPAWAAAWRLVDPALLTITDLNFDGIVQLAEIAIGGDIIVLATPEIAGLPYVVSGLVAAGGLAAALSTADGLLLTIANALGHDLYYKMIAPNAPTARRVTVSKVLLLVVALTAAWVTSYKPGNILFLVGAAFSFAASAFFPALVLGVFWKRANKWGAICGMAAGLGVCMYYMFTTYPFFRDVFGITKPVAEYMWFGMAPISAGVFGVPVGLLTIWIVSLLTPAPDAQTQNLVDHVRYPVLEGDIETRAT